MKNTEMTPDEIRAAWGDGPPPVVPDFVPPAMDDIRATVLACEDRMDRMTADDLRNFILDLAITLDGRTP